MDHGQVTLAQMRYAVAIEGAQSFRQAAERCQVSQAGLSMQVGTLKELLGVRSSIAARSRGGIRRLGNG